MNSELFKDALKKAGIVSKKINPGDLWLVSDELISYPKERLPGRKRTSHESRIVVVLTGKEYCQRPDLVCILVAPLSSQTETRSTSDFFIKKGVGGLDKDSIVCLDAINPLLKIDLKHRVGTLNVRTLDQLRTTLLVNLGILGPSKEEK